MAYLSQILGWFGTGLIVLAYFLVSFKKIEPENKNYQLMNLIGSVALGVNVFYQKAWPALTLEIVWGVIAIVALINSRTQKA